MNHADRNQVPETNRNVKDSDVDMPVSRVADRNQAAVNTLKMQVETAALVCYSELGPLVLVGTLLMEL